MLWQDEITPDQWAEWQAFAKKTSKARRVNTTLVLVGPNY